MNFGFMRQTFLNPIKYSATSESNTHGKPEQSAISRLIAQPS